MALSFRWAELESYVGWGNSTATRITQHVFLTTDRLCIAQRGSPGAMALGGQQGPVLLVCWGNTPAVSGPIMLTTVFGF